MTDIERQAREAADKMVDAMFPGVERWQGTSPEYHRKGYVKGYLAAAEPREKEIAELRAEVNDKDKKLTHLRDVATRELKDRDEAIAKLGRRVVELEDSNHRTHDILDAVRATSARSRNFRPVLREKCGISTQTGA